MQAENQFTFSSGVVLAPLLALLSIWTVFWVEVQFGVTLTSYGLYPRKLSGLQGIIFSPFIHSSIQHLYNNTLPLAVLTAFLVYFYRQAAWKVLVWGLVVSGLLTWCIGRPSYHIGASGLIYVLVSFIFFKGIFTQYFRLVALSLVVVFIYGSMVWYIFPVQDTMSWEGHLAGFVTGLFLARVTKIEIPVEPTYEWEREDYNEADDPFLQHFDTDGNFIEEPRNAQGEDTPTSNPKLKKDKDV